MAKEILIADSNKAEREEFKKIFGATDYNIVFSESGEQALLRLKLFKPDLIIAGASLKEKSGLEVYKAVKADPESKHIPVILLSNIFKEISAEDRKRVQADGVITTPLGEDEVLNVVDRLVQGEREPVEKGGMIGREMEWKSIADIGKSAPPKEEGLLLDEPVETEDEEVIDLVDVVEEPELKMSIHDFIAPEKEEPSTEITPLESWEKLMEEEKPADRRFQFGPDEKERDAKGLPLQLGEEVTVKGQAAEKELLEKIELEEILKKVEQLAPSIEKEWSPEEREWSPEKRKEAPEVALPAVEEPHDKYAGLAEFEAALKRGVSAGPLEGEVQPLFVEKPKKEAPEKVIPAEVSLDEELKELQAEELSEPPLEELGEEEVVVIGEPKEERIEIFEELEVAEVSMEEVRIFEKPKEERVSLFKEVRAPKVEKEEIPVIEEVTEEPEEERIEIFEELEAPEVSKEEVRIFEKPKEERVELFKEVIAPKVTVPEVTAPIVEREEIVPPSRVAERQMEDVISKGAREMIEGFITKLVPEMTQSIINFTLERIERMVKEIVPDLAAKMIQEEIKRLQKGEKD